MPTRRRFVTALSAGAAGLALRPAHADSPPLPSVFGGVAVGVQSYTFRKFDLDRMIAAMRAIGLTSVELWNGHLDPTKASEEDFRAVRRKLDAAGIKVSAYCANFPTAATDEHLDRAFRGAGLLGTDVMTSSVEKPIVPRLDAWCRKYRVRLGLHNHWLGDAWFKGDKTINFEGPADFLEALQGRSEYLAINLDIGHFSAAGHDPVAFFREHHRRIVSLHVKDRDRDAAHTYRRFGEGATPITEVLKLARELRFRYTANIEYELEEQDPTAGVRHAFEYVKRALA
ncbi:MAG TPA: sugar phosphate isomerase/epimerase [Vicinamibacteria bacterium]|nr:sugar phosphate isomerase/epimerase [Vicinamibacteria bacterium]